MKTFTKNMLVPGKHVVELRNGNRYFVTFFKETIGLSNFKNYFSNIDSFDENMTYRISDDTHIENFDITRVFIIYNSLPLGDFMFEDCNLSEIWHREEIFITPDEKAILRNVKGFKYIVRDKDKKLFVYEQKPVKGDFIWNFTSVNFEPMCAFCDLFQMVQWTDDEPWKIEDLLNLPEKE